MRQAGNDAAADYVRRFICTLSDGQMRVEPHAAHAADIDAYLQNAKNAHPLQVLRGKFLSQALDEHGMLTPQEAYRSGVAAALGKQSAQLTHDSSSPLSKFH